MPAGFSSGYQTIEVTIPVLAIGGGGHGGVGEYGANMMRRYAADVTGKVFPGCGHWLPEGCAAPMNEAVLQ